LHIDFSVSYIRNNTPAGRDATMPVERWGALSVKDHLDTQALAADLLLYDRLVFPVFSGHGERTHWRGVGWDPEFLCRRGRLFANDERLSGP
jgi:hypothetical protein